jgi:hypothetical protein
LKENRGEEARENEERKGEREKRKITLSPEFCVIVQDGENSKLGA